MLSSLSVVVPAYNEEENIEAAVLEGLQELGAVAADFEIIIVNDGSTDKTGEIAERLARRDPRVRLVSHAKNLGFGEAEKTGFKKAYKAFVSLVPADRQFAFKDLQKYVPLLTGHDIVVGYRKKRMDSLWRRVVETVFKTCLLVLYGLRVKDVDWVKAYKKEVLEAIEIRSRSAFVDAELLIKAGRKGFKIAEVAVDHYPRKKGVGKGAPLPTILFTIWEMVSLWPHIMTGG